MTDPDSTHEDADLGRMPDDNREGPQDEDAAQRIVLVNSSRSEDLRGADQ